MVNGSVNLLELLRKQAAGGDLDFLREAVAVLAEAVMEAEVATQAGADHGERSPERTTWRNGFYEGRSYPQGRRGGLLRRSGVSPSSQRGCA